MVGTVVAAVGAAGVVAVAVVGVGTGQDAAGSSIRTLLSTAATNSSGAPAGLVFVDVVIAASTVPVVVRCAPASR